MDSKVIISNLRFLILYLKVIKNKLLLSNNSNSKNKLLNLKIYNFNISFNSFLYKYSIIWNSK